MSDVTNEVDNTFFKLEEWEKLSFEKQLQKVKDLSTQYADILEVLSVRNQAIELNLFMKKENVYTFLVSYETYIREQLGNFPIIVLLKDRADENRKRK